MRREAGKVRGGGWHTVYRGARCPVVAAAALVAEREVISRYFFSGDSMLGKEVAFLL